METTNGPHQFREIKAIIALQTILRTATGIPHVSESPII